MVCAVFSCIKILILLKASNDNNSFIDLKNLLSKIPLGGGGQDGLQQMNQMHEESKAYSFNPNDVASPQLQKKLFQLLVTRDKIFRVVLEVNPFEISPNAFLNFYLSFRKSNRSLVYLTFLKMSPTHLTLVSEQILFTPSIQLNQSTRHLYHSGALSHGR